GHCRKHIINLMKNIEKVFYEDKEVYYPAINDKGWNGYGGVDTLIKSGTGIDTLTESFKKHVLEIKK
ncbi:MAG: hypothetical protein DRO67_06045, partial [Candidatus Asgardarchaeum californiense]